MKMNTVIQISTGSKEAWRRAGSSPYGDGTSGPIELQVHDAPQAWVDVLAERHRQVQVEGFDADHDDAGDARGLALAATCYARASDRIREAPPALWPWDACWWKPRSLRENLVRAAALLLAAIEHIDRAAARKP